MRLTHEADPRFHQLQWIKRPRTNEDVQTVSTVRSAHEEEEEDQEKNNNLTKIKKKLSSTGYWLLRRWTDEPAAAIFATQYDLHPIAADGAVGLVSIFIITIQSFCKVILQRHRQHSAEYFNTHSQLLLVTAGCKMRRRWWFLTLHFRQRLPLNRGWKTSTFSVPQHKQKPADRL